MNDQDRYQQQPHDEVRHAVGVPVYPVLGEGGGVMWVNGVPQPLSRRSSRVVIAAVVFATCVVPLIIIAAVVFMMPDFDAIFSGVGAVPTDVPSITITPPR